MPSSVQRSVLFATSVALFFALIFTISSTLLGFDPLGFNSTIPITPQTTPPPGHSSNTGTMTGGYRSVAYFVNWAIYARKHFPQNLPAQNLTHVLYAFANIRPESGEVYLTDLWADKDIHFDGDSWNDEGNNLYGCLKQLNLLKKHNPNLKVLISIGGWTYSPNFARPASTPDGRANFARTAVGLVKQYGFDGIDIDWEYPQNAGEGANLVALLQACRDELDAYSRTLSSRYHFELTVASPAGAQNYNNMDLPGMDRLLDFWNLMAYDYAGSWDSTAGHQANLAPSYSNPASTPFSTIAAIDDYVARGIHPSKIVMGMPLYGRAFENTDGPGTPYSGIGQGTWEAGVYDYKALPQPGAEEREDAEAGATYSYDPGRRVMVSYDTVGLARRKAEFIRQRGLGGGMWWESSADKAGDQSLIGNVVSVFGGPGGLQRRDNVREFPQTEFKNLKEGFPGQ